ncbi:telomerase protein component 1 isoform X2 [Tiliqua scincoides]|uniref:telomerase protein component 1 isoform X2 n=1 Tax=Tiliqua scincoides TaxID=71010 RepID=UPI0034627632
MDSSAHLCVEKPFLPVSLTLKGLEESRARLLHPISPSASWQALLKSPNILSQLPPDRQTKPYSSSILDYRCPSGIAPDAEDGVKKPLSFSEPNTSWLENPLLKQTSSAPLHFQGLEETRTRLLCPIATSTLQLASSKSLDTQFHFLLEPLEKFGVQACSGLLPDHNSQNEFPRPCVDLRWDEDGGSADMMPEYVLSIPNGSLKKHSEEEDPSGDVMPMESEEQDVKEEKLKLVSLVCSSLVEGANFGDTGGELQQKLEEVCKNLAEREPEFILKVALYTRQELNIRSTANFLLVLSSRLLPCRPYLRRYFCHTVRLPSDWLEVAKLHQSLAGEGEALAPMPSCLRAAMTDKFKQFDAYQLAKYNTRKSRGKKCHRRKTKKRDPGAPQRSDWRKHAAGSYKPLARQLEALEKIFHSESELREKHPAASKSLFSLKTLIQRLHICEPAQHVMSLLGHRYPSDLQSFSRSRLPGPWDSSLAGTRMRLPTPLTWERELSQRGNSAIVWEELIDSGKLPFMAMLRNLCNILRAGVSERHHKLLLKRLEDKESVIHSRQLPFRFLAAYKVIQHLEKNLEEEGKPIPSNMCLIKKILKRYASRLPKVVREIRSRRVLRGAMEVPVIFQLVKSEKKRLLKSRDLRYRQATLQRYRQALETAIHLAVRHNVPPIRGRTLILISCDHSMCEPFQKARDLCCPNPEQKDGSGEIGKPLTKLDVAMLLGSIVYSASERAQLVLLDQAKNAGRPVPMTGSVLKDVQTLQALERTWASNKNLCLRDVIVDLLARRQRVDTVLLLSTYPSTIPSPELAFQLYRHHVVPDFLFVNLCSDGVWGNSSDPRNLMFKCGFSEQVLRFMAESGSSRLLEHIGMVDEIHGLPKQQRAAMTKQEAEVGPLLPVPKSRWRTVRVFISSTFRDMHGERDLLIRSVFPELQARAAQFCLAIEDIDLRWGITEHEAQRNKQLELCLSEVSRSHLFIGILGERYGHIPKEYSLPDEPQYEWVKTYPAGRSITELEAVQFLKGSNDPTAESRAFFYLREPGFLDSVPEAWKADFTTESEDVKRRLADLKKQLGEHKGLASLSRYTCQWGGVARDRPFVKGLEDFGARVLQDVWESLQHQFIEGDGFMLGDGSEEQEENVLQESFQEMQQGKFCARAKLLHATTAQLHGGRLCVVSGETGQGKTVFLAALAQELKVKTPLPGDPAPSHYVVAHFTRARPDQAGAKVVLNHLCALLRKLLKEPPAAPRSYRGLVDQFQSLLHSVAQTLKQRQTLVVLIDGADLIHAASGQLVSDWLPEKLPRRVNLVLSVSEESALLGSLKRRKDVIAVHLGPLEPADRAAVVRKDLALYGKKLEESAFNNQMRLVLLKRGSRQPLYLSLLTQDLRLFALYEKLSERIQKLPISLPLLLQHLLRCLEQDHGLDLVAMALVSLWVSKEGLTERDLYAVLTMWKELNGTHITVEEAIAAARCAGNYPTAPFFDFLRSLRGLLTACGSPSGHPGSRLHLHGSPLRMAVEQRYLKKSDLGCTAHKLLAAHWWKLSDPDGSRNFQNSEAKSLTALPYHLVQSGCFHILVSFLTDLRAVSAHIRLGLLHCLPEAYTLYEAAAGSEQDDTVGFFHDFLQRNMGLLSQNPSLLLQQALNEPDSSALCLHAQAVQRRNGRPFLKWVNKPQKAQTGNSLVLTLPATPSCVSIAPSGSLAAVGTTEGTLHLVDVVTGQELKSLLSACDGISACEFLSETTICLGAFNGRLELWSVREGCRIMGTNAHNAQITDCCANSDRKLLATVSLDGHLKLWESAQGNLAQNRDCSCPQNCVTFHPEGRLVATGGWDRTVTILNTNLMDVISVLKGHDSSIRSISFSPAGNVLAAGSLAGSVRLWSWQEAVILGTFSAHLGSVSTAQFLPGGKLLTGGEDGKLQLWKGHLGRFQGTLQSTALSSALCLAPSPNSSRLAVGYHSDDVWVYSQPWDTDIGLTHCRGNGVAICSLAWLDNLFLVGGSNDGSLCIWKTLGYSPSYLHKLQGHDGAVTGLAVSENLVASTSEDFTVWLWLSDTLKQDAAPHSSFSPLVVLRGHTAGVTCCAFSLDGCYLATGGKDRDLFLWDVRDPLRKTPSLLRTLPFCHQDWISSCAWVGPMLLSGSNDCTVCLWDPQTGKRLQEFLGHQSPVCGVTSEKNHVMSVDRDGMLVAWDLQGVEKTRFLAHPGRANHCAVFCNLQEKGFLLAAAGSDGTVNLWKPSVMEQPRILLGHCAAICGAAVSPASSSFLTISEDNTVRVWAAPKVEGGVEDLPPHHGAVTALAWSPDGELAVSGGETGDLIVWRASRPVGRAKVGSCCVSALAFTLPGTVLVASDSISLWDITNKEHDGAVSLTQRKHLFKEKKNLVVCAGMPWPYGPIILVLSNAKFLVHQPGVETVKKARFSGVAWEYQAYASFDISVSEDGILHVWSFMDAPNMVTIEVTDSGKLKAVEQLSMNWAPRKPSDYVTVARLVENKFLLGADSDGALWTRPKPKEEDPVTADDWQWRKIHGAKITALHVLGDRIITASHDQDVKIWQRDTMKLLGQFRCRAPVSSLQPCPRADSSLQLVVGDTLGNVYFLEWDCLCA